MKELLSHEIRELSHEELANLITDLLDYMNLNVDTTTEDNGHISYNFYKWG